MDIKTTEDIIKKIRKRIKTRQMLEKELVEKIQVTKKEAEQLGCRKQIDGVRFVIVEKLGDMTKTDCFAFKERKGHRECKCLDRLYCKNERCNFYKKKEE